MLSPLIKEVGAALWIPALLLGIWSTFWPAGLISAVTIRRVEATPYNIIPLRVAGVLMLIGGLSGLFHVIARLV